MNSSTTSTNEPPPRKDSDEHQLAEKKYTKLFFQRPLSFKQAAAWVFIHYLTIGLVQGYYTALTFYLISNNATFDDQKTLSIATYPYSFKFIISPFLDRFYVGNFGRSKTYIVGGGLIIGLGFMFLGSMIRTLARHNSIFLITVLFFGINSLICVVQIAGEAWILTMFSKKQKTKASTFQNMGQSFGVILGYNVFTPLNDIAFLNQYIFTDNPRTTPLVSHEMICWFIAILYLSQIVVNILFMGEEIIDRTHNKKICKILAIVPKHFTNGHMRNFIFYMFATRFPLYMIFAIFDMKLIKNGYSNLYRSTISNIDLITYPLIFVMSYLSIHFQKKGQLLRMFHLNMGVMALVAVLMLMNLMNLETNRTPELTIVFRFITSLMVGLDFSTFFLMSFFNCIVNKVVGNTGVTCLVALMNQTGSLSRTLGLKLTAEFSFKYLAGICILAELSLLILLFPYALKMDKKDTKLYAYVDFLDTI